MSVFRVVFLVLLSLGFSGCFATSYVVEDFGVKRGTIYRSSQVSDAGDSYLIEFAARGEFYPNSDVFFWKRVDKEVLFATPEQDLMGWKLNSGHIPTGIRLYSPGMSECLVVGNTREQVTLREECHKKITQLKLSRKSYAYKSRWRPFLLPILVPAACVTDVLLAPVLVGYFLKCTAFGCKK